MPTAPQPAHVTPASAHRFHAMDALRGVAALLVAGRHAPAELAGALPFHNSFLAVDFFFCLSGFVVAYAYEKRLLQHMHLRDFFLVRLIRLYPLYLLGTLFGIVWAFSWPQFRALPMRPHGYLLRALLPALAMLPSRVFYWGTSSLFPFNIPAWSVFLEVLANLAYAAAVRLKLASTTILMLVAAAALALLLFHPQNNAGFDGGAAWPSLRDGLARVFFSFPLGVLLFRAHRRAAASAVRNTQATWSFAAVAAAVIAALTVSTSVTETRYFQLLIVAVLFPAVIWFAAKIELPAAATTACAFLGDISYPLYILQYPLFKPLYAASILALAARSSVFSALCLPLYIALLAGVAWLAARVYDGPLRRRLSRGYNHWLAVHTPPAVAVT